MRWDERIAKAVVAVLDDGQPHDLAELMAVAGLPDTWSGQVQFHQGIGWARRNICRSVKREIATLRDENLYLMPLSGDWQPLVFQWLPTVAKDSATRIETIQEMVEVWRLNHASHIPTAILRKMNRVIRKQQELSAAADDALEDLGELMEQVKAAS